MIKVVFDENVKCSIEAEGSTDEILNDLANVSGNIILELAKHSNCNTRGFFQQLNDLLKFTQPKVEIGLQEERDATDVISFDIANADEIVQLLNDLLKQVEEKKEVSEDD
jgi:coenzyme F420-reducing hydrogenase delta subunit